MNDIQPHTMRSTVFLILPEFIASFGYLGYAAVQQLMVCPDVIVPEFRR